MNVVYIINGEKEPVVCESTTRVMWRVDNSTRTWVRGGVNEISDFSGCVLTVNMYTRERKVQSDEEILQVFFLSTVAESVDRLFIGKRQRYLMQN